MRRRKRNTFKSFCRFAKNRSSRNGAPPYMINAGENFHIKSISQEPLSKKGLPRSTANNTQKPALVLINTFRSHATTPMPIEIFMILRYT